MPIITPKALLPKRVVRCIARVDGYFSGRICIKMLASWSQVREALQPMHTQIQRAHTNMHARAHTRAHTHTHMHTHTHTQAHTQKHTHVVVHTQHRTRTLLASLCPQIPYTQEDYEAAKARDPDFYRGADSLEYGKAPKLPEENIDKMVAELLPL
jgi:hypothetical protein